MQGAVIDWPRLWHIVHHELLRAGYACSTLLMYRQVLYGCGLKVGEACGIRWHDFDLAKSILRVTFGRGTLTRNVPVPVELRPVIEEGVRRCRPEQFVFAGKLPNSHLSTDMTQLILKNAARAADITKPLSAMMLRHTFAAHSVETGISIRALQEVLGHQHLETTMLYERFLLPKDATSPLDRPPTPLFPEPLTIKPVEPPFTHIHSAKPDQSLCFNKILKTHLGHRYPAISRIPLTKDLPRVQTTSGP